MSASLGTQERSARGRFDATGLLIFLVLSGACTTFYGLKPDGTSSASSSGSGGSGGSPDLGLLPKLDAAHLCALVASCPSLGASIVESTGIPVLQTGPSTDVRNFSACVDWLTFPLEQSHSSSQVARVGFDLVHAMMVCMAASNSCDDAQKCAFVEALASDDTRCVASQSGCDASANYVDCGLRQAFDCKSSLFAPDSDCLTAQSKSACANGTCTTAEAQCSSGYFFSCATGDPKRSVNCATYGLGCDDTSADSALRGCTGQNGLAACSADALGAETCSGNHLRVCTGTVNAEIDCGAVGETCTTDFGPTGPATCKHSAADVCSPYEATINVCAGTTITVCLDGVKDSVDCAAIGLTCVPGSAGISAHCG